jgi:hypothetical protein
MGPRGRGYAIGFEDYYEPPIVEAWVFVPERRFVAVDLDSYVEPVVEVNTILRETGETFHIKRRGEVVVNEFLPRGEMAKIVDTDIKAYEGASSEVVSICRPSSAALRWWPLAVRC